MADGNVQDGLSIVPIASFGKFTQYEVVYNLSYPTTYLNNALESSYNMKVTASVVEGSLTSGMDGALYAEIAGGAIVPGDLTVTGGTMSTTNDYVDAWSTIFDAVSTVNVDSRGLDFTLTPGATSGATSFLLDNPTTVNDEGLTEGRYSLATFISADDGKNVKIETQDAGASTTIALSPRDVSNTDLYAAGGKTFSIADGSEIFILADKWYDNPETYTRSVTSADALDALNISTGNKTGTNAEIIAADVDKSGSVTAMDAYSILQYAANSTTNMAEFRPEWFYIDDLATLKASTVGATTLDPTSFEFDYEVDQFVGTTDTINVTGVLLGDVTGSYSYLEPNVDPLNGLRSLNINDVNPNAGTTTSSGSGSGSGSGSWTPKLR